MPEDEMVGWPHQLDEHAFEQALGVGTGPGSLMCLDSGWLCTGSVQFSSVAQLCLTLCHPMDYRTPAALQASLSITNSRSLLKLMSMESVMPSNHLILCHSLLLPPSIFPSIRVFSNESVLLISLCIFALSSQSYGFSSSHAWM